MSKSLLISLILSAPAGVFATCQALAFGTFGHCTIAEMAYLTGFDKPDAVLVLTLGRKQINRNPSSGIKPRPHRFNARSTVWREAQADNSSAEPVNSRSRANF